MRAIARPIRHFRSVFGHQRSSYSSSLVSYRRQLIEINSGSAYKLTKDAEIHPFGDPTFMITRALSVEAVKVADGGFFSPPHFDLNVYNI